MSDKPNLTQLLDLVKKMQETQDHLQQELATLKVIGNAGGGLVKVTMNGHYEIHVAIKQEALQEAPEVIADLLIAAHHDAARQIESSIENKTQSLAQELPKGLGLPGDLNSAMSNLGENAEVNKMAQQMQENMLQTREQLAKQEVTGQSGGGLVTVTMDGRHHIKRLIIKEESLQEALQSTTATQIIEELVSSAMNDTVNKLRDLSQSKAQDIVKSLSPLLNMKFPNE